MRRILVPLLLLSALAAQPAAAADTALTAKTHLVKAGHIKLAYRSIGQGPPLVMVMGLYGTIDDWDPPFVDALAKHHRVIVFDNRGVGKSGTTNAPLTIHVMGEDTARLIRALKLQQPDLLGWSMGGFISQDVAVNHRKLVRKVVLAATAPAFPRFVPPTAAVMNLFASPQSTLLQLLGLLYPPGHTADLQAYLGRITKRKGFEVIGPAAAAAQGLAVLKWATLPRNADAAKIKTPTLVAGGAADPLLVPENDRRLAKAIKHSKLKLYPDAAHAFLFQERVLFVKLLGRFLAR